MKERRCNDLVCEISIENIPNCKGENVVIITTYKKQLKLLVEKMQSRQYRRHCVT
jgi:hypothetical protein